MSDEYGTCECYEVAGIGTRRASHKRVGFKSQAGVVPVCVEDYPLGYHPPLPGVLGPSTVVIFNGKGLGGGTYTRVPNSQLVGL
jgi:hypothetical protein